MTALVDLSALVAADCLKPARAAQKDASTYLSNAIAIAVSTEQVLPNVCTYRTALHAKPPNSHVKLNHRKAYSKWHMVEREHFLWQTESVEQK